LKPDAFEAVREKEKKETEATMYHGYWIKTLKSNGKFEKWKIF